MEHIVHRKIVRTGYCDKPYCNIDHEEASIICSCGFIKPFEGDDRDFKLEALSHIVAHGVKGQVAGTVYVNKG